MQRTRIFNVRMTEAEVAMVRDIAAVVGLTQSDTIRQMVRKTHAELAPPPKTRKRARRG